MDYKYKRIKVINGKEVILERGQFDSRDIKFPQEIIDRMNINNKLVGTYVIDKSNP